MKKYSKNTDDNRTRFVPMLFSTPMVQAILNGTKTETRRTKGLEKINESPNDYIYKGIAADKNYHLFTNSNEPIGINDTESIKSKININDVIWVRETFGEIISLDQYCYKADVCSPDVDKPYFGWKPSLFMPKDACRIFLKCVSVYVERLQDIDEQSAINEGIFEKPCENGTIWYRKFVNEKEARSNGLFTNSAKECYMTLWQKINGRDSWNKNPFVWVYKFVRVDAPEDFR
jgi:hypothetical protein